MEATENMSDNRQEAIGMDYTTSRRVAQRLVLASRDQIDLCQAKLREGHLTLDEYKKAVAKPKELIRRIQALFRDTGQPIY